MAHGTDVDAPLELSSLISTNYFDVPLDFASLFTVSSFYVFMLFMYVMVKGKLDKKFMIMAAPIAIVLYIPKVLDLALIHPFFDEYDFGALENRWIGLFILVSSITTAIYGLLKKPNANRLFISIAALCVSLGIFVTHITSIQYNIRTNAYLSSEYMQNIAVEKDFNKFVELCNTMHIECLVRDKKMDFDFIEDSSRHIAFEFRKLVDNTEHNNVTLVNELYQPNAERDIQTYGKGTVSVDFHESQAMAYAKVDGLYRLVYSDQNTFNVYQLNAWNFFIVIYLIIGFWIIAIWGFKLKHPEQETDKEKIEVTLSE